MIYQENLVSYRPALWMSLIPLAILVFLYSVLCKDFMVSLTVFLTIEGAVLLACSLQPADPHIKKSLRDVLRPQLAGPTTFAPLLYYAGLILIAAGAFVGGLASN